MVNGADSNWTDISRKINKEFSDVHRTGKQCRERWHNYLDPDIKTAKITAEEEVAIFNLYK